MTTFACRACPEPVARRYAVIRSVNFEQVAWHRECAEREGLTPVGWDAHLIPRPSSLTR